MANGKAINSRFKAWKLPFIVFGLLAIMMTGVYFSEPTTAQLTELLRSAWQFIRLSGRVELSSVMFQR
jgi:hypothetical protein